MLRKRLNRLIRRLIEGMATYRALASTNNQKLRTEVAELQHKLQTAWRTIGEMRRQVIQTKSQLDKSIDAQTNLAGDLMKELERNSQLQIQIDPSKAPEEDMPYMDEGREQMMHFLRDENASKQAYINDLERYADDMDQLMTLYAKHIPTPVRPEGAPNNGRNLLIHEIKKEFPNGEGSAEGSAGSARLPVSEGH